jgi:hypothetical protein
VGDKMNIFFINAPAQLTRRALHIIKNTDDDITIVTVKDLVPFLQKATDAKLIVSSIHPNLITQKTKKKLFNNTIKSWLEYNRLFKGVKGETIHLFFDCWSIVYLYYVKKLSKNNKVIFYPEDSSHQIYNEEQSFRAFIMRLYCKLFFGLDIKIMYKSDAPVWQLKENAIPMETKYIDKLSDTSMFKELDILPDNIDGKTVLFLADKITQEGADEESVISLTDCIMYILKTKFDNEYMIKLHPRENHAYGTMKDVPKENHIDKSILAEVLWSHPWKFIIGYYAEALMTASYQTDAKVISLFYLWEWTNPDLKRFWESRFQKAGVIMPKNMEELDEILVNSA